jgi:hypothetical protein
MEVELETVKADFATSSDTELNTETETEPDRRKEKN